MSQEIPLPIPHQSCDCLKCQLARAKQHIAELEKPAEKWIVSGHGRVLHFSRYDGWDLQIV